MVERVVVGPWKTNCYIYSSSKKECIVIDPGGDETEIASRVDVLNMVPVGIALTHGHVDHVAALGRLRASYASRGYSLKIAIHSADRKFLGTSGRETHRESLEFLDSEAWSFFGMESMELPRADVKLSEGDRVFGMDLVVLETPGHTPGGVCFYSEKEGVLFSGDTLFFDGHGRTDLPGGNEKKLRESFRKKLSVLPPETRVFPGHGPFTTIEREKRSNDFLQEPPPAPAHPEPPKQEPKKTPSRKRTVKKSARARPSAKKAAPARAKDGKPRLRKPVKASPRKTSKPKRARSAPKRAPSRPQKPRRAKGTRARARAPSAKRRARAAR